MGLINDVDSATFVVSTCVSDAQEILKRLARQFGGAEDWLQDWVLRADGT